MKNTLQTIVNVTLHRIEKIGGRRMKRLSFLLGIMTMVGCAIASTPTLTYLPDGRQAYTIECSNSTECFEQAGWVCGRHGYELAAAKTYGSTSILTRSVVIACK